MNLIDLAIEFAAKAHQNQRRKGTNVPYISHPYGVGMLLLKASCKEEVIVAGILHDTLEDTETTLEELIDLFGPKVADIVKGCTEPDKDASWEDRKQHTLDYLKQASLSIRQVACADKLHNLRSIKRDLQENGEKAWDIFKRGREKQQWYYTRLVESLGFSSRFPLLNTFQDEVEELFGTPLVNEDWRKLRRNKEFFDLALETVFAGPERREQLEQRLDQMGGLAFVRQVEALSYPVQPEMEKDFEHLINYLQDRGIEFQSNSEGPIMLIGFCTVLKKWLNLYPHELYHHFKRNLKRGIL